jgi:hypothetical protein
MLEFNSMAFDPILVFVMCRNSAGMTVFDESLAKSNIWLNITPTANSKASDV